MNLDLTSDFVNELEGLREQIRNLDVTKTDDTQGATFAELTSLNAEINQLKGQIHDLERTNLRLFNQAQTDVAQKEAALRSLRAEFEKSAEVIKIQHAQELSRKNQATTKLLSEALQKEKAKLDGELASRTKLLEEEATRKLVAQRNEWKRLWKNKLETVQDQVVSDFESGLARLAYVPMGLRFASLLLDVSFVILVTLVARRENGFVKALPEHAFLLAIFVVFSLRSILSPGNLLLGVAPRRIGPDLRPAGPSSLSVRLFSGVFHYGPLIVCAFFGINNAPTREALTHLLEWAYAPGGNSFLPVLDELYKPQQIGVPGVIFALASVWWILLLLSFLCSPLVHRSTPYFRNTTLVEFLLGIGFQRFSPPKLSDAGSDAPE